MCCCRCLGINIFSIFEEKIRSHKNRSSWIVRYGNNIDPLLSFNLGGRVSFSTRLFYCSGQYDFQFRSRSLKGYWQQNHWEIRIFIFFANVLDLLNNTNFKGGSKLQLFSQLNKANWQDFFCILGIFRYHGNFFLLISFMLLSWKKNVEKSIFHGLLSPS